KRYPKLLAANLLSKVVQLLSFCYPKFWRPVIRCRADVPSRSCCSIFGQSVKLTLGRTAAFRGEQLVYSKRLGRTTVRRDEQQGDSFVIESFNYPNKKGQTQRFF